MLLTAVRGFSCRRRGGMRITGSSRPPSRVPSRSCRSSVGAIFVLRRPPPIQMLREFLFRRHHTDTQACNAASNRRSSYRQFARDRRAFIAKRAGERCETAASVGYLARNSILLTACAHHFNAVKFLGKLIFFVTPTVTRSVCF